MRARTISAGDWSPSPALRITSGIAPGCVRTQNACRTSPLRRASASFCARSGRSSPTSHEGDAVIAVIFEGIATDAQKEAYLDAAARLRPLLADIDGFLSIERF